MLDSPYGDLDYSAKLLSLHESCVLAVDVQYPRTLAAQPGSVRAYFCFAADQTQRLSVESVCTTGGLAIAATAQVCRFAALRWARQTGRMSSSGCAAYNCRRRAIVIRGRRRGHPRRRRVRCRLQSQRGVRVSLTAPPFGNGVSWDDSLYFCLSLSLSVSLCLSLSLPVSLSVSLWLSLALSVSLSLCLSLSLSPSFSCVLAHRHCCLLGIVCRGQRGKSSSTPRGHRDQ